MQAEILTTADHKLIEEFLSQQDFLPIQQTLAWEQLQNSLHVCSYKIGVKVSQKLVGFALVFERVLPFGLRWLHLPRGILGNSLAVNEAVFRMIVELGKQTKAVFIRFDWKEGSKIQFPKLQKAHQTHFPQTTLRLDLRQSEEQLLTQMKPKGRYNIRIAEKHGVQVRESHKLADVKTFFNLLRQTTQRDGFAGHTLPYYENFLQKLDGCASCFLADYKGKTIAASLHTFAGDTATYYYGSSDYAARNVMAAYALQWKAIRTAKERGYHYYDFLGIAPQDSTDHAWSGVTDFKKKFGGAVIDYSQSEELVLRKNIFSIVRFLKKLRG